jgi:YVTN family beta-propeller protein
MTRWGTRFAQGCLAVLLMVTLTDVVRAESSDYLSPVQLTVSADGDVLFVAEATARQIAFVNVERGAVDKTVKLLARPTGLVLSPNGRQLFVTDDAPEGAVHIIDTRTARIENEIPLGHTPSAPVISADGATLYVCNRFNNNVAVIDVAARKVSAIIPVTREPIGAALSKDGGTLFVINHLPAGRADSDFMASVVSVIDTKSRRITKNITLPNGSTGVRDIALSIDGRYAYITHTLARFLVPTTQLDRGWMNTNALSIIDVRKQELYNTVLLDEVDLGAANPWDVVCTPDGRTICVALSGTDEVAVLDADSLHAKLQQVHSGNKVSDVSLTPEDVPNDLSFLLGVRKRVSLPGKGPRGLAVVGNTIYAAEYYSDNLAWFELASGPRPAVQSIGLGPEIPQTPVRRGEMLFHDATNCFQQWQSCTSCHPDVGTDALNWDLLNDGIGNPKQVKNLLLAHQTPPSMVTGVRADAETAVRAGIRFILFAVLPDEDAQAIDVFLKSRKPVPSPLLVNGKLSDAAKRGRKVFEKAECNECHDGEYYTNLQTYDLQNGKNLDAGKEFDVPTLIECWRTAPYLHDGRAGTMDEMITEHNAGDLHGKTSGLSKQEVADLVEYVLSL